MLGADLGAHLAVAFALIAALAVIQRVLPPDRRARARVGLVVLVVGLVARGGEAGAGALGFDDARKVLDFIGNLALTMGSALVADLLLFDVILERFGVPVPRIVRDVLQATAFFVLLFGLLGREGVNILPLVTTSAVLTAVIGLALQNTISNVFAGLALQLDRAFVIGDWIKVGDQVGRITQIRWRSSSILTRDNDVLVVPNGQLTSNQVLNISSPTSTHRVGLRIAFHARHAPNEVRSAIVATIADVPGVCTTPEPTCAPAEFTDVGVTYQIHYWITDHARELAIDGDVKTRIWYAARRLGLEMPTRPSAGRSEADYAHARELAREQEARNFEARIQLIGRIEVFEPLDESDRRFLAERVRTLHFGEGERIIRQGEPGDSLYFIHSGRVSVQLEHKNAATELATLGPTDFFGEMSLLTGEPRAATVRSISDVTVFVVDHAVFKTVLEAKPRLVEEISTLLSRRRTALREKETAYENASGHRDEHERSRLLERIRQFFDLDTRRREPSQLRRIH